MAEDTAKYRKIFEHLRKEIRDGRYPRGVPLPSEESLVRRYKVSRITAVRAMEELVKSGLVYRKRGAGTFATKTAAMESGRLGLIMPSLSFGEVFPRICQGLMRCAQKDGYTLLLGDISAATPEILALFDGAEIPVVLIDRNVSLEADTIRHDFVGIDSFSAGRALGEHVIAQGAKRVRFLMRPNCATVISDRLAGAAFAVGKRGGTDFAIVAEPDDVEVLAPLFRGKNRPDAVICESDYVAAVLRNTLDKLGLSVPKDVMLAGFDDVRCAVTMFPPLTTVHQPCEDIALLAYRALRERMRDPFLPPRRILVPAPLVVRESTKR